jgi:hypothetical protein
MASAGSRFMKVLPMINLTIASSALVFQVTVLYPWHAQLEGTWTSSRPVESETGNSVIIFYVTTKLGGFPVRA